MEITVSNQRGTVPVTVVQPHGDVDASNFSQLISKVQALQSEGVQDFILDLSDVPFMSSAGLVALHSIANMLRGEKVADGFRLVVLQRELHQSTRLSSSKFRRYASYIRTGSTCSGRSRTTASNSRSSSVMTNATRTSDVLATA